MRNTNLRAEQSNSTVKHNKKVHTSLIVKTKW